MKEKFSISGALLSLLLLAQPAHADENTSPPERNSWIWGISLGVTSWTDLSDISATTGGSFDSQGIAVEMAGHKTIAQLGSADLLLGVDLGFISTDSDIAGVFEELLQRGLYLTPSLKLRFGEPGKGYLNLEAGAGWYQTDFAELNCDDNRFTVFGGPICTEINDPFDENTFGSYVGVSTGLGEWFTTGLKVHFADFGPVTNIPSINDELNGPFYILSFGAAFGN